MTSGGLLNYKYGWELTIFRKLRDLNDGLSFINLDIDLDLYKGDHKPSFNFHIILFNYTIIEFLIYNVNHTDAYEECEDNYGC